MSHSPLLDRMDGKIALSSQVVRLDDGRRIYRRRRMTTSERVQDLLFRYVLPAGAMLMLAICWVLLFWIGAIVMRVLRGEGI